MLPRGVEEGVIFDAAPGVEREPRGEGRSTDRCVGEALAGGLAGRGGEDGEGLPKGESAS